MYDALRDKNKIIVDLREQLAFRYYLVTFIVGKVWGNECKVENVGE